MSRKNICPGFLTIFFQGRRDTVETLDPPTFHWEPWENHCGGVSHLHLDTFSVVAANSCVHRVASRCVEPGDHSTKDNVLVYDFWNAFVDGAGRRVDLRRPQKHPNANDQEDMFEMGPAD